MKVFLAGLAIAAAAIGGGIGYAGMQTTGIPEWYNQETDQSTHASSQKGADTTYLSDDIAGDTAGDTATHKEAGYEDTEDFGEVIVTPHREEATPRETRAEDIVISEGELSQMVKETMASQPAAAALLDASQGINTAIDNGRIESGAVMNLSKLPLEALPAEGQQAVEQLTQTFPFLANRDVYLGLEGRPTIVDGQFSLDDTHIKIGQLKLPIANVASQLGISQADIESQLGTLLEQQGLTPEDVQIIDGQLVIKGAGQ